MDYIKNNNIFCSSYLEENYPDRLKYCIDGPVLLFSTGAINWNNKKIISIVGTRQVSAHGIDFCKKLIQNANWSAGAQQTRTSRYLFIGKQRVQKAN